MHTTYILHMLRRRPIRRQAHAHRDHEISRGRVPARLASRRVLRHTPQSDPYAQPDPQGSIGLPRTPRHAVPSLGRTAAASTLQLNSRLAIGIGVHE